MTRAEGLVGQSAGDYRRLLTHDELEAWLRELPWWREWIHGVGERPTYLPDGNPMRPEDTGVLERIRGKVALLDAWVGTMTKAGAFTGTPPKLGEELAQLVQFRYMTKTPGMGLPIEDVVMTMRISRRTFHKYRERALDLLVTAVYLSGIDLGEPYSDCRDSVVPRDVRQARKAGRRGATIRRPEQLGRGRGVKSLERPSL